MEAPELIQMVAVAVAVPQAQMAMEVTAEMLTKIIIILRDRQVGVEAMAAEAMDRTEDIIMEATVGITVLQPAAAQVTTTTDREERLEEAVVGLETGPDTVDILLVAQEARAASLTLHTVQAVAEVEAIFMDPEAQLDFMAPVAVVQEQAHPSV